MYIPEKALGKTNRLSFPSNFSRHTAPEGCSAILAEITYQPGDEVSSIPDKALVDEVLQMLQSMKLCTPEQVVFSSVERQPFAYVVYDLGYQKNIAAIRDFLPVTGYPLVGRVRPVRVPEHGWLYPQRHGLRCILPAGMIPLCITLIRNPAQFHYKEATTP